MTSSNPNTGATHWTAESLRQGRVIVAQRDKLDKLDAVVDRLEKEVDALETALDLSRAAARSIRAQVDDAVGVL